MKQLERGSSSIDWCENNYAIFPGIAEFFNCLSNAMFILVPPLLVYLYRPYSEKVNSSINIMWVLLMIVGTFSIYFHATLSLVGQLLDEVSIIWVVFCGVALWYPRRYYPALFNGNRRYFKLMMFLITMVSTFLACMKPSLNNFFMMPFIIPCLGMLVFEMRRTECKRITRLGRICGSLWVIAVMCWMGDFFLCDIWQNLSFPYLHCMWHILVFVSAYTSCVLFSYFDAQNECPEMGPVLRYWPKDSWVNLGVPYVTLKCSGIKPID